MTEVVTVNSSMKGSVNLDTRSQDDCYISGFEEESSYYYRSIIINKLIDNSFFLQVELTFELMVHPIEHASQSLRYRLQFLDIAGQIK